MIRLETAGPGAFAAELGGDLAHFTADEAFLEKWNANP
jgi:hypothetical protein